MKCSYIVSDRFAMVFGRANACASWDLDSEIDAFPEFAGTARGLAIA